MSLISKDRILRFWNRYSGAVIIYVAAALLMSVEWVVFRLEIHNDHPSVIATFYKGLADICVILLPFFFLRPNLRWLTSVPVFLLSIFFEANILYFRVFHQLIPLDSVLFVDNFDSVLIDSTLALFKKSDIVYLVCPALFVIITILVSRRRTYGATFNRRIKMLAVVATLLYYLLVNVYLVISYHVANKRVGIDIPLSESISDRYFTLVFTDNNIPYNTGLIHYFCISLAREFLAPKSLDKFTDAQRTEIIEFIKRRQSQYTPADSTFINNRDKNLIFIIVESLNASVVGQIVDGAEVTPNLNRLVDTDGNIVALNVVSQVGDGRSSDGQMIYNTGLLPLQHGSAAMTCSRNKYESLAGMIGKDEAVEIIGEDISYWNHITTSGQFGFDKLLSVVDSQAFDIDDDGYDKAIFELALEQIPRLKKPFYMEITTLSSHLPFTGVGKYRNDTILNTDRFPEVYAKYLNSINYFDAQLGHFIKHLDQLGVLSNSVVVIAADHNIDFSLVDRSITTGFDDIFIPFIALNTGISHRVEKIVGQCDVFPTILDVMGVRDSGIWRGVGLSMFNNGSSGSMAKDGTTYGACDSTMMRRAFRVSDLLLRGYGTKEFSSD